MGPIDRYKKYDHFPWKFLLHIFVIVITSFQVFTLVNIQTDFAYNAQDQWNKMFMYSSWNDAITSTGEYIIVYDIKNLRDLINSVVPTYYGIKDDSQNQLDDIKLFDWSALDEKMFAEYTAEERKKIGLANVSVGDIKPIEGVARMIDKSEPS